jgi:hypothetical protein
LLAACLLLVMLASGIAVQIAAQPTTWKITLGLDTTNFDLLLLVNDMSLCIPNFPLPFWPGVVQLGGLKVYEGACGSLGLQVGLVSGTLTIDTSGTPGPFSMVLVYTVGFPGLMSYHSSWSFSGGIRLYGTLFLHFAERGV